MLSFAFPGTEHVADQPRFLIFELLDAFNVRLRKGDCGMCLVPRCWVGRATAHNFHALLIRCLLDRGVGIECFCLYRKGRILQIRREA